MEPSGVATHGEEYAERLIRLQTARWKQWLDVQAPFRWNLRRLDPGVTLDVGCGIGRNLVNLSKQSVGIDANEYCVRAAQARGLIAFTPSEFQRSTEYNRPGRFDAILLAHVAEHMTEDQSVALMEEYEPLLRPDGRLILISPQEAGFKSDATHVELMDFARLSRISERLGLRPERAYSFPFPRWAGRLFTYNEFVVVSRKPRGPAPADQPAGAARA
jgi:2-polyprenyl-3-methyl-5-hydroxy-6-metoxy-1,4-benzoquinol methylase